MAISLSNGLFRVISDGERLVLLRDSEDGRECWMFFDPYLTRWSINCFVPHVDISSFGGIHRELATGLPEFTADLSLVTGRAERVDGPLVMGVDIFKRYTVTDYLDIINEKLKGRK